MTNKPAVSRLLSALACFVLIAAMALTVTGCQTAEPPDAASEHLQEVSFTLTVTDGTGEEKTFEIRTSEKTVGAALLKEGLIEGEEGPYGLYIRSVDGITADFDTDGTYWAFYIDGEYAVSGVDSTEITPGSTYSLKVEKG